MRGPDTVVPSGSSPPGRKRRLALGWVAATAGACVLALAAYEGYAVFAAQGALPEILAKHRAQAAAHGLTTAQLDAIVRVQDPAFRTHSGIEWPNPMVTTTITQSLVKRLFFASFRPGFVKIEQTLIARFVLNPAVNKDEQLALFVATAYFGHPHGKPLYGFRAAAEGWYRKPLQQLGGAEFLALLAMMPAPSSLPPGSAAGEERVARIRRLLTGACAHTRVADIWLEQCRDGVAVASLSAVMPK